MYLGIDLGTSAIKLLLMKASGDIVKTVSKSYPIYYTNSNWAEQDPSDWWEACKEAMDEVLDFESKKNLKGISFSGQMHGLVTLDKNDEIIRNAILWCDQRTEKECRELNNLEWLGEETGNQALTGFTAPKILWMKENEIEKFNNIEKIMLPKDYLAYKFSGIHAIDVSDASGTLMLDVKNRTWSKKMLDFLQINTLQLGKIYESWESIGYIKPELAEKFGISKDIKIIIGGGDQAVGAVGVGAINEGIISLALGTSGVIFAPTDNYQIDSKYRLHSFCDANGRYHQMGVMLSAAGAFRWWVEEVNESKDYELFNKIANDTLAGSENLFFLPYLIGERTPHNDSFVKGSFIGLSYNHKKGHMTRSVLEGVAYSLRDSVELLKDMDISISKIRVSGGGAKSYLWKQILSDTLNCEIISIDSAAEGPALGAAILASVGCGEYKNVEEACNKIIKEVEIIKPILENVEIYEKGYEKFRKLYPSLKDFYSC